MSFGPIRIIWVVGLLIAGLLTPTFGGVAPASAAALAVASSSSGSSSSRSSITLARPAGTAAGHVMVAQVVSNDSSPGFSAPSGWSLVSDRSISGALRQAVYFKVAGPSETSSYRWSLTSSRRVAGGITSYSGVDTVNPVVASATGVNTAASTSVTAPSITTIADTVLVHLAALNAEGTMSPPVGMTERWEAASPHSSTTRDALASASDAVQPAAGPTGPRTATATRSGRSIATLLALRSAGPPPPPDTVDPETMINSGPSGVVASSSATFTFSANEPATFRCSFDGADFSLCSSPKTYSGLADGGHTFRVFAVDLAGNDDLTPEERTWTSEAPPVPPAPAVLVGAGDIANCGGSGDERTAALLDGIQGTVFTIGDNAYEDGTGPQFNNCYHPSWGRHKSRTAIAVSGNHDYQTEGAAGHYAYFGAAAGDPTKGYFDTREGAWHVIVLNSECDEVPGGCGAGSPQVQWLRSVLAQSAAECTVAMSHRPRFSSGSSHGSSAFQPFWQALYDHGAELVLNGHDHIYERFGLQSPTGGADAAFGLRQITVERAVGATPAPRVSHPTASGATAPPTAC